MIALLAALTLVGSDASPDCALSRLELCRNTNELVWDDAFDSAVRSFLGRRNAHYLYDGPLADQQLAVLGGPPDEPTRIGDLYRFTACRAHSCMEKGVAVLEPDGDIVALGILHARCGESPRPDDCAWRMQLTVFSRQPTLSYRVVDNLEAWAAAMVADSYSVPGLPRESFEGLEIVTMAP